MTSETVWLYPASIGALGFLRERTHSIQLRMCAEVSGSPPVLAEVTTVSSGAGSFSLAALAPSTPSLVTQPLPRSMHPPGPKYLSTGDSRLGFDPPAQLVWCDWNMTWNPLPFAPDSPYSRSVVNVS